MKYLQRVEEDMCETGDKCFSGIHYHRKKFFYSRR